MEKMFSKKKGQTALEYGLLIAVVVLALVAINIYMKKGVQGRLKESTDQIGRQFTPDTFETSWRIASSGNTQTREIRTDNGELTTNIEQGETVTKSEYDTHGTAPNLHY